MPIRSIEQKIYELLLSDLHANVEFENDLADNIEDLISKDLLTDAETVLNSLKHLKGD